MRVSPTGTILGPAVTVATPGEVASNTVCALGFDGAQYLLVYLQASNPPAATTIQLSAEFLSPLTGLPTAGPFLIAAAGGNQMNPALAFDGANYLVAWEEITSSATLGLNAARVSPAGVVPDPVPVGVYREQAGPPGSYEGSFPALAFDGSNYLVVYHDGRAQLSGGATVSAARISPTGLLLDGTPTSPGITVTSDKSQDIGPVNVAFLGGQYWLVWEVGVQNQLYGAQVSIGGAVTSPGANGFSLATNGSSIRVIPVVSANAHSALLSWDTADNLGKFGVGVQAIFALLP